MFHHQPDTEAMEGRGGKAKRRGKKVLEMGGAKREKVRGRRIRMENKDVGETCKIEKYYRRRRERESVCVHGEV